MPVDPFLYAAVVESFLKSTIVIDSLDELPAWVWESILNRSLNF